MKCILPDAAETMGLHVHVCRFFVIQLTTSICLATTLDGKPTLPAFTHINCKDVHPNISEDICIEIDFNDDEGNDFAVLSYSGATQDKSMEGYLLNELAPVISTGLWEQESFDDSSSYYITILSSRLIDSNRFLRNSNGSTSILSFNEGIADDISNDTTIDGNILQPQEGSAGSFPLHPLPLNGMKMDVLIFYDTNIKKKYGGENEAKREVNRMMNIASMYYKDPSLTTQIHINIIDIIYTHENSWKADRPTLKNIKSNGSYFDKDADAYLFLCKPEKDDDNVAGKAEIGTTCDKPTERVSVVEIETELWRTSYTVAHEIAHNLGARHDFYKRYDVCLLYTSPSPRDATLSRMPSSA